MLALAADGVFVDVRDLYMAMYSFGGLRLGIVGNGGYLTLLDKAVLPCCIVQYSVLRYLGTVQHSTVVLCAVALHCTALQCSALHCTSLRCTALHSTLLHCTALHRTTFYCTALHCTALYCTVLGLATVSIAL